MTVSDIISQALKSIEHSSTTYFPYIIVVQTPDDFTLVY